MGLSNFNNCLSCFICIYEVKSLLDMCKWKLILGFKNFTVDFKLFLHVSMLFETFRKQSESGNFNYFNLPSKSLSLF